MKTLWLELMTLVEALEAAYLTLCEPLGISIAQLHVLLALLETDKQKASALARQAGLQPTSFTPPLDDLETKGYIVRKAHPTDRRALEVCLTERGAALRPLLTDVLRLEATWRRRLMEFAAHDAPKTAVTLMRRKSIGGNDGR